MNASDTVRWVLLFATYHVLTLVLITNNWFKVTKTLLSLGWAVMFCLMGVFHITMAVVFFQLGIACAWFVGSAGKELK